MLSLILGVLLVSLFLEHSLKAFAVDHWSRNQMLVVNTLSTRIHGRITDARRLLEFTARQPLFQSLHSADPEQSRATGIPQQAEAQKRHVLEQLTTANGPFSVSFIVLPNGDHYLTMPYSLQQKLQPYNLSERTYFKRTQASGKTVISDSYLGADGKPAVAINTPLRGADGQLIGYLGGVIHLTDLSTMLDKEQIAPFEQAALLDRQGTLIAHSDPRLADSQKNPASAGYKQQLHRWHELIGIQQSDTARIQQHIDAQGQQWLNFIKPLPGGWTLIIQRRVSSVLADFSRHISDTILLIGFILLTVCGFGIWVSMILGGRWAATAQKLKLANDSLENHVENRTRELNQTKQQLQLALEGSSLGLWDWYIDSGKTVLDENWGRLLGLNVLEMQPATIDAWLDRVHPDDRKFLLQFTRHKSGYRHVECVLRMQHRNGDWLWIECRGMIARYNREGTPSRLIGTVRDISMRKETEAQLRQSARVFEHAHEGIMITDSSNRIINVNRAFTELTGYSYDEVLGQHPSILNSGHQSKEFYSRLWYDLDSQGYWKGEIWNRKKNGELYAEQLTITALRNSAGETDQYIGIFSDITHIKEQQNRLEQMAHYDALTGLPNRILLADRMDQALSHTNRMGNLLAVAYLDLDDFKPINDRLGHAVGDKLLVAVAKRLKECVRGDDTVSRLGGDEFVLLLPEQESVEQSNLAIDRIIKTLTEPYYIKGNKLTVSASIGISLYPLDNSDADTLLRHADQAMYTAKQAGRNRYHYFDPNLEQVAKQQQDALSGIEHALENEEFVLFYQPKVNMRNRQVIGAEALIRWQHPEHGLLFPDSFLPAIENTRLSVELGHWVIDQALQQLNQWHQQGLRLNISVNIAARHLESEHFIPRLKELLAHYPDLPAQSLELEILETSALEEMTKVARIIDECHKLGITVALDDFGTGYSSLTYFKKLPVDTVKIDRSFVIDMLEDEEDLTIVEGVIGLASAFQRKVIAEGVETCQHGHMLLQMGCDFAQGYGIARAMPAEHLPDWTTEFERGERCADFNLPEAV